MPIQVNDNGIIRTLNKIQVNDNGIIRELSKVQANDNGVIREIFSASSVNVEYTGDADIVIKNAQQGYVILKSSGTFTFTGTMPEMVDLYIVGAGENSTTVALTMNYRGGRIQKYISVPIPVIFLAEVAPPGSRGGRGLNGEPEVSGYSYIRSTNEDILYSNEGGVTAEAGEYNPLLDFWGRNWAGGGGGLAAVDVPHSGNGGSNGAPGDLGGANSRGGGGGSSPIGGGGGGAGGGLGGYPNGGDGSPELYSGRGEDSFNGGGAGGGPLNMAGIATGGGGNGGSSYYNEGNTGHGGGGGGLGGGAAGATTNVGTKGTPGVVAQGGGGAIIIRWGDSPL